MHSYDAQNRQLSDGLPLFLLFLQEIISKRPTGAAEILGFRPFGQGKNSQNGCSIRRFRHREECKDGTDTGFLKVGIGSYRSRNSNDSQFNNYLVELDIRITLRL